MEKQFLNACYNGNLNLIKKIFSFDFSDEIINKGLLSAAVNDHLDVVKFLIEYAGADVRYEDYEILKIAAERGYVEMMEYIIPEGADVNAENDEALKRASKQGRLEAVEILLNNGVDINSNDDYALRYASKKGHSLLVQFLIENGANIYANDNEAIKLAAENGHLEIVQILAENGAIVNSDLYSYTYKYPQIKEYLMSIITDLKEGLIKIGNNTTQAIHTTMPSVMGGICGLNEKRINTNKKFNVDDTFKDKSWVSQIRKNFDPIDPITSTSIPSNLYISVYDITEKPQKSLCFNCLTLYEYWLKRGIAVNPINDKYFTEDSVKYVQSRLEKLGLF